MKSIHEITLDWIHARVVEQDGCLIWTGACGGSHGLPQVSVNGTVVAVRRVMWELVHERAVPAGRRVSPSCGNSKCIHPDHVRALPANQVLRGTKRTTVTKAKIARGHRARSAWNDAAIREVASGTGLVEVVAAEYGMTPSYVSKIRLNKRRIDFTNPYLQLLEAK